jgi:3-oxoacyl-[acyl-carrier protein] reductase
MSVGLQEIEDGGTVLDSREPGPECRVVPLEDRQWAEAVLAGEKRVPEMIAGGNQLASQAAAKQFDGAAGSIINLSSIVSTLAVPQSAVYSGTKGAVDAITCSLAAELGPRGIRVNAIRPGMVETEGTRSAGIAESDMRKQVETQTPLRRIGQPRDIAGTAVFLASDDSSWITGETFVISAGYR